MTDRPHFEFVDPYTGSPLVIDGASPLAPPEAWFSQDAADAAPEKLVVFPGGRVAGVVAPAGRCLLNGSSECWMIPKPANDGELRLAHTGFTTTAEGTVVATAVIGGGAGHASEWASVSVAQQHYANTSTQLMRGTYRWSDQAGGLVFVGAVWPDVTPRQVAEINASPASIDYRWIEDENAHRLVGACLVNIGGLPTRWKATRAASAVIVEPERDVPAAASPAPEPTAASVTPTKEAAMVCESCAKTAAGPPVDGAPPAAPADGDLAATVAELAARLDALEMMLAEAQMASLAALDVSIPA